MGGARRSSVVERPLMMRWTVGSIPLGGSIKLFSYFFIRLNVDFRSNNIGFNLFVRTNYLNDLSHNLVIIIFHHWLQ